ncbi:MAG: kinase/pyrophosphorylase [Gammaproteobacteria bacterium]|nr:kinase/pyrophosphorylase [Gammaproteobacteria bacterium]
MQERTVFIISDRTGITAETMCHSLLSQFPGVEFKTVALPYVDSDDKVNAAVTQINEYAKVSAAKPLVFTTLVHVQQRTLLRDANAVFFDLFDTFIDPLEKELGIDSSQSTGQIHGVVDPQRYTSRISAVNYSMHCDDGLNTTDYDRAALILLGVSRSGKTPTCLYLALHFGIFVANFPLTDDEFDTNTLPKSVQKHKKKCFGLSIKPERLQQIRQERMANSRYAQLQQCQYEVKNAESLYRNEGIEFLNTTAMSIEEITTTIIQRKNLRRDFY